MAVFEVFIPAGGATAEDSTLNIDAPSWVAALRSGLSQLGEQGDAVKNIMVDRKPDGSIMVSHPKTGRVFRIRELSAEEADGAVVMPAAPSPTRPKTAPAMPAAAVPAASSAAPAPAPAPAPPAQVTVDVARSARAITTSMPAAKGGKHFEVFIPAGTASTSDVTLTVEAVNWIGAIKTGLARIGESADAVKNIMVDRKPDKSFKISHPKSGRVFLVKEISAEAASKASAVVSAAPGVLRRETAPVQPVFEGEAPAPAEAEPPVPAVPPAEAEPPAPVAAVAPKPSAEAEDEGVPFPTLAGRDEPPVAAVPPPADIPTALRKPPEPAAPAEPDAIPLEVIKKQPAPQVAAPPIAETAEERADTEPDVPAFVDEPAPLADDQLFDADEVLASVFEDTMLLSTMSVRDAIDFALDLALDKVDAEGGSVIVADINSSDMVYASSRGPTANAMLGERIPMDEGLLGFTVSESVGLSVAEADDPEFFKGISAKAGVDILNVMYAPMEADRRVFGAIELVNRLGAQKFSQDELNVITFLGTKLAEQMLASESTGTVEID